MADKQSEGFVRQRRNLMIASLVLLFSEATDLKVEKISAFGTELLVGHPRGVAAALWIAGIYWLLRFYQYSRAEYKGVFEKSIQHYVQSFEVVWPVALRRLLKDDPVLKEPLVDNTPPQFECEQYSIQRTSRNFFEIQLRVMKSTSKVGESVSTMPGERTVRVDGADLFWLRVKAWIHLTLNTTLFTELFLPYIVFALPVLYAFFKVLQ